MSVTLQVNTMSVSLKRIQRKLDKLPREAYDFFKDTTPIKTGNARRSTKLKGNTIEANYQYAQVLDKGRHMTRRGLRGSDQAPQGMTKPTQEFVKKRVGQILKAK
jgi:hypothetical protein